MSISDEEIEPIAWKHNMSLDEQQVHRADDGWLGTKSCSLMGAGLILASLVVLVILPGPDSMAEEKPVGPEMQMSHEEDDSWEQEDVDPAFALDGRPFFIEPAAGPPASTEPQTCIEPVVQQIDCGQQIVDEQP